MPELRNIRYSHDAVIDAIIANPTIHNNELAAMFGYSPGWMSIMVNSDVFQARLAARRDAVVDPILTASIEERFNTVARLSLQKIAEKLAGPGQVDENFLLKSAKLAGDALGYGARPQGNTQTNVAVVVQVPAKQEDAKQWVEAHGATP